jgi:hypothetical protein
MFVEELLNRTFDINKFDSNKKMSKELHTMLMNMYTEAALILLFISFFYFRCFYKIMYSLQMKC